MRLTKAQQQALKQLYDHDPDGSPSYLQFRRRVFPLFGEPQVAMIQWRHMTLGIEPGGYCHS